MNKFKRLILVSVCFLLIACEASDDLENNSNSLSASSSGNSDSGGAYKSNYCVGDNMVDESDDIFIMMNAFALAKETPPSIKKNEKDPARLANALLYGQFSISAMSVNLIMAVPMIALGLSGNKSDFPYWQGSYTTDASSGAGETTITWRRSESTEYFNSTSSNGEFLVVSENSDCSGTLSEKRINKKNGEITTTDGSWKISGTTTTGEVTRCSDDGCYSLSW